MARRRRKSSSGKLPEPLRTMFDLSFAAGMLGLSWYLDRQDQKKRSAPRQSSFKSPPRNIPQSHDVPVDEDILALEAMVNAEQDVSENDIEPQITREEYETRDEYVAALNKVRYGQEECEAQYSMEEREKCENSAYSLCRISRLDNGKNENCWSDDLTLRPGEQIQLVGADGNIAIGIVLTVEVLTDSESSAVIDRLPKAIRSL